MSRLGVATAAADGALPDRATIEAAPAKSLSIQAVRAVAACLVVVYHQAIYFARIHGDNTLHDLLGGRPGLYGVAAFFVLSGFLMAHIAPRYRATTFLAHRVVRIYPAYWLTVVFATLLYAWLWRATLPDASYVPDIGGMLSRSGSGLDSLRLVLAPIAFPDYPLGVEWTLLYETSFYVAVFAACALSASAWLPHLAVGWLLVLFGATALEPAAQLGYTRPDLATFGIYGINAAFVFGILARHLPKRIAPAHALGAGIALLIAVEWLPTRFALLQTCGGVALIVAAIIALEHRRGWEVPRGFHKLGDWSYAMYLVHVPVVVAVCKLAPANASTLSLLLASGAAVLAASALLGELDVWLHASLRTLVDRARPRVRMLIAAGMVAMFAAASIAGLLHLSGGAGDQPAQLRPIIPSSHPA